MMNEVQADPVEAYPGNEGQALVPAIEDLRPVPSAFRYGVATKFSEMKDIFEAHQQLMRELMNPGIDFGPIPGTTSDRVLFKAGAEKLQILHGYAHEMILMEETLDWDLPLFHYRYRCDIYDRRSGSLVGQAYGSCNSRETKYAYRWVAQSKIPPDLINTALPSRKKKRGKRDWTVYRIPNPDLPDLVNTIDKMAQKRAFVGAVRLCTGASGLFLEEGVNGRDNKAEAVLPTVEEAPNQKKAKKKAKKEEPDKLTLKLNLLFNRVNAVLQEEGITAYYKTSEHVKNTLSADGGLSDKQIVATGDESLLNLLVRHAKEALA